MLAKINRCFIYLFIFLLPCQTRYIFDLIHYQKEQLPGLDFSLYFFELILLIIVIFTLFDLSKNLLKKSPQKQPLGKKLVFFLTVFLILILNCLLSQNISYAFFRLSWIIEAVCFLFILKIYQIDRIKIIYILIVSGILQSLLAIWQFAQNKIIANKWLGMATQNPEILGTPVVFQNNKRILRAFGSFPHPNMLAGFLVLTIIFTFYLWLNNKNKFFLNLALIIQTIGFYLTFSRAGFLALIFGLIFFTFLDWQKLKLQKFIPLIIILIIFLSLSFLTDNLFWQRFDGQNNLNQKSNSERLEQIKTAWPILHKNILTGVGLGNYQMALTKKKPNNEIHYYQPAHNVFILIIAETGLLGLSAILLFFLFIIFNLFQKNKNLSQNLFLTTATATVLLAFWDHYLWSNFSCLMIFFITLFYLTNSFKNQSFTTDLINKKKV